MVEVEVEEVRVAMATVMMMREQGEERELSSLVTPPLWLYHKRGIPMGSAGDTQDDTTHG